MCVMNYCINVYISTFYDVTRSDKITTQKHNNDNNINKEE